MMRPYQSPNSGSHCGPQCAQMPNLALRNQSGVWYFSSDCQSGANGPAAMVPAGDCASASAARATPDNATAGMAAPMCFNKSLRFIVSPPLIFLC
jgi:hypothetical protein